MEQEARNDLIAFCILTHKDYFAGWHHEIIAQKLMAVERGEIKRLILMLPPRHGKSLLASISFPAWYLGRNPDREIITASYSQELAVDFGSKTRDLIQDEIYQNIFNVSLKPDEKSKSKWMTSAKGTYTSVGIGGAITGRGANILIIDDPIKNREEADSVIIRDKVWNWYTSTAYTRLEKDAAIILILTRWHLDDLAGRLVEAEKQGGERWEIVKFPALAIEDEKYRQQGEPLWESKYSKQVIENIKQTIGLLDFSALYQQEPILAETQEFREEYFRYFDELDLQDKRMAIHILIDPAISKRDEACNTGVIDVAKLTEQPFWHVLDDRSGKLDPLQVIEMTFTKVNEYKRTYPMASVDVWIETVAFQEAYMYFFKEEMRKRQEYFNINEIKTRQDKNLRIRGLIPLYKTGVIKHRAWMKRGALEGELVQFPVGRLVDRIDALSFIQSIKPVTAYQEQRPYKPMGESVTGY